MRKYVLARDEVVSNKGKVIMRKINRIMTPYRIAEIKECLIELFIETFEERTEDEVA